MSGSQIVSTKVRLRTREQIETVISNFAKARHFTKIEKIFEGKPSFGEADLKVLNEKYNMHVQKISKFAENYIIYKLSGVVENDSVAELRMYNSQIKIKNLNDREEIVIVVDTDVFDKLHYNAIIGLFPHFADIIDKQLKLINMDKDYITNLEKMNVDAKFRSFDITTEKKDCLITIMATNQASTVFKTHFNINILPASYRLISMVDMYPILGSKSRIMGKKTKNYELCEFENLYNGGSWADVYDSDITVKILNGIPGDLIICQGLFSDVGGSPHYEYMIGEIKESPVDQEIIQDSGLKIAY